MENLKTSWTICIECDGRGKKSRRLGRKVMLRYHLDFEEFEKSNGELTEPIRPVALLTLCLNCAGSGIVNSVNPPIADNINYPHVAIIGAGIGGVALAVACLHRGIPFSLYERDNNFDVRSQGYGLTLQQASLSIKGLGILSLNEAVVSNRHVVHTPEGKIVGEWGMRKWVHEGSRTFPKRTNMHIARQALRLGLLQQLGGNEKVHWNHQLVDIKQGDNGETDLFFQVNGELKQAKADLVVGADGIRSAVRKLIIGDEIKPLRYLGCIVILGICPLSAIKNVEGDLLDSATVFQTANGHERIYIMPFTSNSVMWQLSFPISEKEAKDLSLKGTHALKQEACRRTQWHHPIPQILSATLETQISGYPVYDRELLNQDYLKKCGNVTLIGDAAHPMSPFKGQGANQALLDALALARSISKGCNPSSQWRTAGIRERVLNEFEVAMLERCASKVKDSAEAAKFLHSDIVLHESNEPRGKVLNRKSESNKH